MANNGEDLPKTSVPHALLRGKEVYVVGGTDTSAAPIMAMLIRAGLMGSVASLIRSIGMETLSTEVDTPIDARWTQSPILAHHGIKPAELESHLAGDFSYWRSPDFLEKVFVSLSPEVTQFLLNAGVDSTDIIEIHDIVDPASKSTATDADYIQCIAAIRRAIAGTIGL